VRRCETRGRARQTEEVGDGRPVQGRASDSHGNSLSPANSAVDAVFVAEERGRRGAAGPPGGATAQGAALGAVHRGGRGARPPFPAHPGTADERDQGSRRRRTGRLRHSLRPCLEADRDGRCGHLRRARAGGPSQSPGRSGPHPRGGLRLSPLPELGARRRLPHQPATQATPGRPRSD
jgi:hypothetical protein